MSTEFDLRNDWAGINRRLRRARSLGIMMAFDGILTSGHPSDSAALIPSRRSMLETFSRMDRVLFVFHSGRPVAELTAAVAIEGAWYVGYKGLEIKDPQGKVTCYYGPEDTRLMETLAEELTRQTDHIAGVNVVREGPSLRVDYRRVESPLISQVLETFRTVLGPFHVQVSVSHRPGGIEARVRCACDEGTALRYAHRRMIPGTLFFYFGDQSQLHDGLRQLVPPGVIVNVSGKNPGTADFTLPGPADVFDVLERIASDWHGALQQVHPG